MSDLLSEGAQLVRTQAQQLYTQLEKGKHSKEYSKNLQTRKEAELLFRKTLDRKPTYFSLRKDLLERALLPTKKKMVTSRKSAILNAFTAEAIKNLPKINSTEVADLLNNPEGRKSLYVVMSGSEVLGFFSFGGAGVTYTAYRVLDDRLRKATKAANEVAKTFGVTLYAERSKLLESGEVVTGQRRVFDIGHVATESFESPLTASIGQSLSMVKGDPNVSALIQTALDKVHAVHSAWYNKLTKEGPNLIEAEQTLIKELSTSSISGEYEIILTLPQWMGDNSKLAVKEGLADRFVRAAPFFAKKLLSQKGSPSLEDLLLNSIEDRLLGKKPRTYSSRTRKTEKFPVSNKLTRQKKEKLRTRPTQITPVTLPPEPFTLDLLSIIRASINKVVKENMGSPRLNYRTGRFADSVEALSAIRGKTGLWTIGYTYQTRPYQTFEPGFSQGSAKRDPKSLIRESIRQIVAPYIGAKFRAVRQVNRSSE